MERALTVVIGAGAGCDYDMPTGEKLKPRIVDALKILDAPNGGERWAHDGVGAALLKVVEKEQKGCSAQELREAAAAVRESMVLARSIDQYIDSHKRNPAIEICAKLAIAYSIASSEGKSKLQPHSLPEAINFDHIANTWMPKFYSVLTLGAEASELKARFSRIAIITFNYDRCLEHFLLQAIRRYHRLSHEEACDVLSALDIFHAYGSLGPLPWQRPDQCVSFGKRLHGVDLVAAAGRIRTFTQGHDPDSTDIEKIRHAMISSSRVLFLGFAYRKLNMQLLHGDPLKMPTMRHVSVMGSAKNISEPSLEVVRGRVQQVTRAHKPVFVNKDCCDVFDEFEAALEF